MLRMRNKRMVISGIYTVGQEIYEHLYNGGNQPLNGDREGYSWGGSKVMGIPPAIIHCLGKWDENSTFSPCWFGQIPCEHCKF